MSPNRFETQPVYLQSGDPEEENTPSMHAPGTLGMRFTVIQPTRGTPASGASELATEGRAKRYQLVRSDSTIAGIPQKHDVAWWSDRRSYLVTTDPTGRRGQVAGVFQRQVDLGNFCCVQIGGPGIVRLDLTTAPDATGLFVVPSTNAGRGLVLASGTAATFPPIGRTASLFIGGQSIAVVDIDIPETV